MGGFDLFLLLRVDGLPQISFQDGILFAFAAAAFLLHVRTVVNSLPFNGFRLLNRGLLLGESHFQGVAFLLLLLKFGGELFDVLNPFGLFVVAFRKREEIFVLRRRAFVGVFQLRFQHGYFRLQRVDSHVLALKIASRVRKGGGEAFGGSGLARLRLGGQIGGG